MAITRDEANQRMAGVIARSWRDSAYADQLQRDPRAALAEAGLDVPDDDETEIIFHIDSPGRRHYVIPANPRTTALDEAELEELARESIFGQLVLPTIV